MVCRSDTLVSPAKTAAAIEMPFRLWARLGPRNHVLGESPQLLRDVAMATNFGTKIAITRFERTIATSNWSWRGFEWSAERMQILPIPCT